jgi:PDZ domain-containing protein
MVDEEGSQQPGAPGIWPMAPEVPEPQARPFARWAVVTMVAAVSAVVLFVAGFVIRVPYSTISPGEAVPLTNLVHVDGATKTYDTPRGDIRLLFVRERNHINLWRFLAAHLDSDTDVFGDKALNPSGAPQGDLNAEGDADMALAKIAATKVALQAAGYSVKPGRGLVVLAALPSQPAGRVLRAQDVILSADGHAIRNDDDLKNAIAKHKAGDKVTLAIERNGKLQTVSVGVAVRDGRAGIGVFVTPPYDFPLAVSVDTAGIGGPSGGLAMTLAILDDLTPGNLTGGKRVAVTGTIDADGNVGEIGGIEQKAVAARAAHVQLFIVPECSPDDPPAALASCKKDLTRAERRVGSNVRVVPVSTFAQARQVLRENGGDPVTKVAPAADAA